MRYRSLLIVATVVFLIAGCTAPAVTPTATATIAPTPTSSVDPCLTTAKTYKPSSLPPGKIAFECNPEPARADNIYVFDTSTGHITKLTNTHGSLNSDIHWSPDGRKITFLSERDNKTGSYVMNADGSQLKWLIDNLDLSWSPDGKSIACGRDGVLYMMKADGKQQVRLADDWAGGKSWSPDGKRLAFAAYPHGIHTIEIDGTHEVTVTNYSADIGGLAWSPTGDRIYFLSYLSAYDGPVGLYQVNTINGQMTRLASAPVYIDFFTLSPDGTQIVFRDDSEKTYLINSDGSEIRQLLSFGTNRLSWSPDSQYLTVAYGQLAVVKVDTGQIITLTDSSAFVDYPQWSPK